MDKDIIGYSAALIIGAVVGLGIKVESRTVVREVQPRCVHKYRSLSCVVSGDLPSRTANVIQECENCGAVRTNKLYL